MQHGNISNELLPHVMIDLDLLVFKPPWSISLGALGRRWWKWRDDAISGLWYLSKKGWNVDAVSFVLSEKQIKAFCETVPIQMFTHVMSLNQLAQLIEVDRRHGMLEAWMSPEIAEQLGQIARPWTGWSDVVRRVSWT